MVVPILTTIQISDEEAKMFVMMQLLRSLGVFDIKSGSVTIHFGKSGEVGSVDVHKKYQVA